MWDDLDEMLVYAGESGALQLSGYDDCIVGIAERCSQGTLLVYDVDRVIEKLMSRDSMTYNEAQEFFQFNIAGAWMGEGTPLLFSQLAGPVEEAVRYKPEEDSDVKF